MILCSVLLSSCGFSFGNDKSSDKPAKTIGNTASKPGLDTPPIANDRPGNALPGLQPPLGVNTSSLFPAGLDDDTDRINRLETAVQALRNDFDEMAPAMTRLAGVEGDLQDLITQLEALLVETEEPEPAPAFQPAQRAPMPLAGPQSSGPPAQMAEKPPPAPPPSTTPPPVSGKSGVLDMRVGEHPDKTRIVLDVGGAADFSYDLDNGEKILVIELPNSKWQTTTQGTYSKSPVLKSYRTDSMNNGAGARLILQLKGPATVIYSGSIKGKRAGEKRVILDLGQDNAQSSTQ